MIPLPVIFAVVSAVAGATGAHLYTRSHYETVLAERTAAHATALAQANADALAETVSLQAVANEATRKSAIRIAAVKRDAAAARTERDGLLNDLAAYTVRLPGATCTAAVEYASTVNELFGICADQLGAVAAQADGHASDAMMLREAWPLAKP